MLEYPPLLASAKRRRTSTSSVYGNSKPAVPKNLSSSRRLSSCRGKAKASTGASRLVRSIETSGDGVLEMRVSRCPKLGREPRQFQWPTTSKAVDTVRMKVTLDEGPAHVPSAHLTSQQVSTGSDMYQRTAVSRSHPFESKEDRRWSVLVVFRIFAERPQSVQLAEYSHRGDTSRQNCQQYPQRQC